MDLSEWSKLNRDLRFLYTKKKFFNEFCYSLTYNLQGARCLINCKTADKLPATVKSFNFRNTDRFVRYKNQNASLKTLEDFYKYYTTPTDVKVKFRIGYYSFTVFADSESYLYNVANEILSEHKTKLSSVSLLEFDSDKKLLDQGFIITKKESDHPYKVRLKEGFIKLEDRHALVNYIKNLDSEIKISKFILERLSDRYKYFQGGFIYLNDIKMLDILKMLAPSLIGSVNQTIINQKNQ